MVKYFNHFITIIHPKKYPFRKDEDEDQNPKVINDLIIESTNNTPAINFFADGRMNIKGRSLPENVKNFYSPLIEWASSVNIQVIKLDINLEYINSSSAKKILEFLQVLDANNNIKEITVNWFFEQEDEDVLECGQIFEEFLRRANFQYHEYSEAA